MRSVLSAIAVAAIALMAFVVGPGSQAAVTVQTSGVTVLGTVVDDGLQPVGEAEVTLLQNARVVRRTTTSREGAFSFSNVSAGRYQIRATRIGLPAIERELVVPAGVETIRVPLVMAATVINESDRRTADAGVSSAPAPPAAAPAPPPAGAGRQAVAAPPRDERMASAGGRGGAYGPQSVAPGEGYAYIRENRFRRTVDEPLSTFGADVDTASFTNVRRFLRNGQLPPADAVRVEEFVNYFRFDYAAPTGGHPIGITTEVADAPWAPRHKLVLIGARAAATSRRAIAGRNIVLLIDVSGSMASADKLPLLKAGLGLFVDSLAPSDCIAIVTYAGTSGVALPSTPARNRDRIRTVIDGLGAGGSTNGAGGLISAYRIARQAYIPGGVNRVILATDGDFNVGVTSHDGLVRLIEREKESGVFLSVLGVGTGNLQDATMELLADKGNGHYAYLDSFQEARRVLVREADSTMETVAKDVKFQVEFNPAEVASWKLVGYENRLLAHEDFNDDRKDGGEMGAGHTVTVLYEIVPVGAGRDDDDGDWPGPAIDPLRYQASEAPRRPAPAAGRRGELLTVKVRYQEPEGNRSRLITQPVRTSPTRLVHLPFASAVAEFGMLLRDARGDRARWTALERRLAEIRVPREGDELAELVTLAASLRR